MINKRNEVKIAEHDIVCYKIFSRKMNKNHKTVYRSYWQGFEYEKGECYFEDHAFVGKSKGYINTGLHSYKTRFYLKCGIESSGSRDIVVQCTIPEGAKYYENETQYVSDYLIIGTR